jgi:general secretion pathway protein G
MQFSALRQRSRQRRRNRGQAGFSLIEILVALALLAALAGLVIGGFGGVLGQGQENVAKQFVEESLETPLMRYRIDNGNYPTTEQGLDALMNKPATGGARWRGPYIDDKPVDPWGTPYKYRYPGTKNPNKYDIWSLGPDMVESADDIGNWE